MCLLLLGACGRDSSPTAEQNRQLANTEELLNAAPDTLSNVDQNAIGQTGRNSAAPPP